MANPTPATRTSTSTPNTSKGGTNPTPAGNSNAAPQATLAPTTPATPATLAPTTPATWALVQWPIVGTPYAGKGNPCQHKAGSVAQLVLAHIAAGGATLASCQAVLASAPTVKVHAVLPLLRAHLAGSRGYTFGMANGVLYYTHPTGAQGGPVPQGSAPTVAPQATPANPTPAGTQAT